MSYSTAFRQSRGGRDRASKAKAIGRQTVPDWAGNKKKKSASSHAVYNIAMFSEFTGSAAMHSPALHIAYQLTAAKVKASELLIEYELLGPIRPISAAFKGKGKAPANAKKRKRDDIDDDNDNDEEDMDDRSDGDGSGSGSK